MTERWLIGALAAGALLGLAALAAEPVAGWFGLPRRWIWAVAMAGSFLLPSAAVLAPALLPEARLPAWRNGMRVGAAGERSLAARAGAAVAKSTATPTASPSRLPAAFGWVWLAASLATLGTLLWSRRRLRGACGPCVGRHMCGIRVLVSERAGPMVLGLLDPEIVVPRWAVEEPEDCALMVRHEREHVLAGDPWLLALASLAVVALPWSPALWWQHRRLRLAVETDCDARVLATGESRQRYGRVLLSTAARPLLLFPSSLAWGGSPSHLERRLLAMTASRPRYRLLRAIPLAALACAGAAAACGVASEGRREDASREVASRPDARVDTVFAPQSPPHRWDLLQGRVTEVERMPDGTSQVMLDPMEGVARSHWLWTVPVPASPAGKAGLEAGDVILFRLGARYPGELYVRVRRRNELLDVPLVAAR